MARRRKSKTAKWIVTGTLTALIAGGGYLAMTSNRPATRPGIEQNAAPEAPTRPAPKVGRTKPAAKALAAKPVTRPVAPVSMPVDMSRKTDVPRPRAAVGSN